jgi:hypothetical protein
MNEVMATCPEDVLTGFAAELRAVERAKKGAALEAFSAPDAGVGPDDVFAPARTFAPPLARPLSDPEDAIGLVRRGVRVAPVAETTPLLPLYQALGRELPPELRVAASEQNYEFYLVALTFSLRLEDDESPDHAEFVVKVRDGVTGPRASRAAYAPTAARGRLSGCGRSCRSSSSTRTRCWTWSRRSAPERDPYLKSVNSNQPMRSSV